MRRVSKSLPTVETVTVGSPASSGLHQYHTEWQPALGPSEGSPASHVPKVVFVAMGTSMVTRARLSI